MTDPLSLLRTAGSGPRAQEEEEGSEGPQIGGPIHQVAGEGRLARGMGVGVCCTVINVARRLLVQPSLGCVGRSFKGSHATVAWGNVRLGDISAFSPSVSIRL